MMIKFLFFIFLCIFGTIAFPLDNGAEVDDSLFNFCQVERDCDRGEFCFINESLRRGICVVKVARTEDSEGFNPMDVKIVNEEPIALPSNSII